MTGKLVRYSDHPDKDVRKWLKPLDKADWRIYDEGHGFRAYCPCAGKCSTIPIPSTPGGNKERLRRNIQRTFERCPLDPDDPRRSDAGRDREQ